MKIDPENKSSDNLSQVAYAAQKAGIADESTAYEAAIEPGGNGTDPATSHGRDDAEIDEIESQPS